MESKIVFNGKEYKSVEEMPADVRQAYEKLMGIFADANRDGTPDLFEPLAGAGKQMLVTTTSQIVFNGQTYNSVEDMPAEARRQYEQGMSAFDADRDGVPDALENFAATNAWAAKPAPAEVKPASPSLSDLAGDTPALPESKPALLSAILIVLLVIIALLLAALLLSTAGGLR